MKSTVSFQAPAEIAQWLDGEAKRRLVSKSDVVREILVDHIRTKDAAEHVGKTRQEKETCVA